MNMYCGVEIKLHTFLTSGAWNWTLTSI